MPTEIEPQHPESIRHPRHHPLPRFGATEDAVQQQQGWRTVIAVDQDIERDITVLHAHAGERYGMPPTTCEVEVRTGVLTITL